jgi:hypothetical protein
MTQPSTGKRAQAPPRWAEALLRACLGAKDRETIAGDLAEEYQETVLPARGRFRADLWYLRQVASVVWHLGAGPAGRPRSDLAHGLALAIALSLAVFATNILLPVMSATTARWEQALDAEPYVTAGWLFVAFLWGAAGFAAYRRTSDFRAAIRAGAIVALTSIAGVMVAFAVIDNAFLDIVSRQPEKIWGFQQSHYPSMRSYLNHTFVRSLFTVLPVLTAAGALIGAVGGAAARIRAAFGSSGSAQGG